MLRPEASPNVTLTDWHGTPHMLFSVPRGLLSNVSAGRLPECNTHRPKWPAALLVSAGRLPECNTHRPKWPTALLVGQPNG